MHLKIQQKFHISRHCCSSCYHIWGIWGHGVSCNWWEKSCDAAKIKETSNKDQKRAGNTTKKYRKYLIQWDLRLLLLPAVHQPRSKDESMLSVVPKHLLACLALKFHLMQWSECWISVQALWLKRGGEQRTVAVVLLEDDSNNVCHYWKTFRAIAGPHLRALL